MACGYYINRYGSTSYRCNRIGNGGIAGVVVGIFFFCVFLIAFFLIFRRCLRSRRRVKSQPMQQPIQQIPQAYPPAYDPRGVESSNADTSYTKAEDWSYYRPEGSPHTAGGSTINNEVQYTRPSGPPPDMTSYPSAAYMRS